MFAKPLLFYDALVSLGVLVFCRLLREKCSLNVKIAKKWEESGILEMGLSAWHSHSSASMLEHIKGAIEHTPTHTQASITLTLCCRRPEACSSAIEHTRPTWQR